MHTVRRQIFLRDDAPDGGRVRVAIIDTGADVEHPDLVGRVSISESRSFTAHEDLVDRNGHGTHVAGIIGGSGRASRGYLRGIAPGSELIVYKIAEAARGLEWSAIAAAEAAIAAGVDVVNYSHGHVPKVGHPPWLWPSALSSLEELFTIAADKGILCVVAAGNAGPEYGSVARPAGLECVLTVGAVGLDGRMLDSSSRGPYRRSSELRRNDATRFDREYHREFVAIQKPDVVAPGVISAPRSSTCALADRLDEEGEGEEAEVQDPLYIQFNGTSQAAAVVSGLAAALLSLARSKGIDLGPNPGRSLRRLICRSAAGLAGTDCSTAGSGMVMWPNLVAALEDFVNQPRFREFILDGTGLRLMP